MKKLFANLTIIDWLGSPYAVIMLESCHNIKLASEKGKEDARRQQTKAANVGKHQIR